MEPIFNLSIELPPRGSRKLLQSLHEQLRAAILDGRLQPGLRLPATRELAALVAVSRNTVVEAYDLLFSEGYIVVRPGAGAYVTDIQLQCVRDQAPTLNQGFQLNQYWRDQWPAPILQTQDYPFDFRLGAPDKRVFPFQIWQRLSTRSLRIFSKSMIAYAESQGQTALRKAITAHISYTRAVACCEEDLVVTAGAQQAFDLLARILVTPGVTTIAVEDPGYAPVRASFAAAGANVLPVTVDGEGICIDQIPAHTKIIYVTPTHQFPLGHTMSLARRSALLDFAQTHGAVIIEDDYDSEFRFGARPLDALQTLDRHHSVFYIGTFSKKSVPGFAAGFIASPPWARSALVKSKQLSVWHGPLLEQETLAAFIGEGHLLRHIRKMRKIYDQRRSALMHALASYASDFLHPIAAESGLHLTALVKPPFRAKEISQKADQHGIRLPSLDIYPIAGGGELNGFAFGYGMIESHQMDAAIQQIVTLMQNQMARSSQLGVPVVRHGL